MARNFNARLKALEAGKVDIGATVRQWLGMPLSDADKAEIEAMPPAAPYVPLTDADLAGCSPALRAWLLE